MGMEARCSWCREAAVWSTPFGLVCDDHLESLTEDADPASCFQWTPVRIEDQSDPGRSRHSPGMGDQG